MRPSTLPPALTGRPAITPQAATALFAPHPATSGRTRGPALLLACGNSLRQDDGIGLRIAEWAERKIPSSQLRVLTAQQFTPEMAADLAATDLAIFVDASVADEPGAIRVAPVHACTEGPGDPIESTTGAMAWETHGIDPPALLELAESLCGHKPALAFAVTIGARSFGYGDQLTGPLRQSVPRAVRLVANLVAAFTRRG